MKKSFLVLLVFFSLSVLVSAQTNYSANCDVKVSIIKALTIENYNNSKIDFGEIIMDGTAKSGTVTNQLGGHFLITGHPNRNVTITYPATLVIDNNAWVTINGGTNGTITFTAGTADQTGKNLTYTSQAPLPSGTAIPLVNDQGTGKMNVWIGGSIAVPSNTPHGDYIGQYAVTVHY